MIVQVSSARSGTAAVGPVLEVIELPEGTTADEAIAAAWRLRLEYPPDHVLVELYASESPSAHPILVIEPSSSPRPVPRSLAGR